MAKVTTFNDLAETTDEPMHTPEELARKYRLHTSTIRKMFIDVEGVVRIGHSGGRRRRQYFTLRIPASVERRVFGQMTVT